MQSGWYQPYLRDTRQVLSSICSRFTALCIVSAMPTSLSGLCAAATCSGQNLTECTLVTFALGAHNPIVISLRYVCTVQYGGSLAFSFTGHYCTIQLLCHYPLPVVGPSLLSNCATTAIALCCLQPGTYVACCGSWPGSWNLFFVRAHVTISIRAYLTTHSVTITATGSGKTLQPRE